MSVFDSPAHPTANPPAAWARRLKALGLGTLGAAFLAASQPLAPLAAQILYISQPVLGSWLGSAKLNSLAEQLEQADGTAGLIRYWQDETL